jgi:6-pyruvoyltetrahydropterin/6-carboxytetrahydropterin synthase
MFELTKQFIFDSAHTLAREVSVESSKRIHGHSYRAEVTVRGHADAVTGMVIDLGLLEIELKKLQNDLDHHFLNQVPDLGIPTMENICLYIWRRLQPVFPTLYKTAVYRDSGGNSCVYYGNQPF